MSSSSSIIIINSVCYILILLTIKSTYSYVIQSDEPKSSIINEPLGFHAPTYYERILRTTKFPRIGRSLSDTDEISSSDDPTTNIEENEETNNDDEFRWIEQRSVFFPRIGKRSYHHLLWKNSLSNPYRVLDGQGRYHINDDAYNVNPVLPTRLINYRGK